MLRCIVIIQLLVSFSVSIILASSTLSLTNITYEFIGFVTDKAEFIRNQYLHLNWFNREGKKLTDGLHPYSEITDLDIHCEIETNRAGTFHFYFIYEDW